MRTVSYAFIGFLSVMLLNPSRSECQTPANEEGATEKKVSPRVGAKQKKPVPKKTKVQKAKANSDTKADSPRVKELLEQHESIEREYDEAVKKTNDVLKELKEQLIDLPNEVKSKVSNWSEIVVTVNTNPEDIDEETLSKLVSGVRITITICESETKCTQDPQRVPNLRQAMINAYEEIVLLLDKEKELQKKKSELSSYGIGPDRTYVLFMVGEESKIVSARAKIQADCLKGERVEELGKREGIINLSQQEGGAGAETDDPVKEKTKTLVSVRPEDAFLIMLVEYEGRIGEQGDYERRCSRIRYFREAPVTSVDVSTRGYSESGNNIDLLPKDLREQIANRLETNRSIIIPVRRLIKYKASRAAEETLRDNQEIQVTIKRALLGAEKERAGNPKRSKPYWLYWTVKAKEMPRWSISMQANIAIFPLDKNADDKSFFTVGPGTAITWRVVGTEGYFGFGPFVYIGATSSKVTEDAPKGFEYFVMGTGLYLDLSGYLGIGIGVATDMAIDRGMFLISLNPLARMLQAIGLESHL